MNLLRGLCVSERSRCGAVRISKLAGEPSAEIVRVGSLSLWRRANYLRGRRTLCRDCACRIALAVAPCEFLRGRRTLCGDCACRIALAVAPREFQSSPTNPLRRLCVSERSRCGQNLCTKVVREARSRSSGLRIVSLSRKVIREVHSRNSGLQ